MQGNRFPQIDAFRFLAIFFVLTVHWHSSFQPFTEYFSLSVRGVDLFFVISGFLITLGLFRAKTREPKPTTSLYKFYARRFLRIFPIYYVVLLFVWLFNHKQVAGAMPWHLFYLSNFYFIKMESFRGLGHLWSLSVEEQFYLVWPLLILFIPTRKVLWAIIPAIALSIAAKTYWQYNHYTFWTAYMHPLGSLDVLALGGLLAYGYNFHQQLLRSWLFDWRVITLVLLQAIIIQTLCYIPQVKCIHEVLMRFSFGLLAIWLIGRAAFGIGGWWGAVLSCKPILFVGRVSYCFYLVHVLVPGMLLGLTYPVNEDLRFIMYFFVTLGISSVSWYIFESQILKLKDRFE